MKQKKYHGNRHGCSAMGRVASAYAREYDRKLAIGLQMSADAAVLAASDVCELTPEESAAFLNRFAEIVNEISALLAEDGKDDKDLVYSTETIDRALRAAVGEKNFTPWEERYGG